MRSCPLPEAHSEEYVHLARRMGYERGGKLDPGRSLNVDFETHSAIVRAFIERHFGRESIPGEGVGNAADLVLSEQELPILRERVFRSIGCRELGRAYRNLRNLAGFAASQERFARLSVLACDVLGNSPDPDMALNNWERFVSSLPDPQEHYDLLLSQPRRLDILLDIFAASQFLADILIRDREFLDWVTDPEILHGSRSTEMLVSDMNEFLGDGCCDHVTWMNRIRRFRRREILRIGTRDICLKHNIRVITRELSCLADALSGVVVERVWLELRVAMGNGVPAGSEDRFCVIALGKLGGRELNYSSDIDLLGAYAGGGRHSQKDQDLFAKVLERLRGAMSTHTEEGYLYRVDLRLRPHGRAGVLVNSVDSMVKYYENDAALWELQALLKARPIAGAMDVGNAFLSSIQSCLRKQRDGDEVIASIRYMREIAATRVGDSSAGIRGTDVKSGLGGIRDVEFLVQGLQMLHLRDRQTTLFEGNTLEAIRRLVSVEALDAALAESLAEDYVFLRRIEHFLQILEDRQIHAIPVDREQLQALARRVMGSGVSIEQFGEQLRIAQTRIREAYEQHLPVSGKGPGLGLQ